MVPPNPTHQQRIPNNRPISPVQTVPKLQPLTQLTGVNAYREMIFSIIMSIHLPKIPVSFPAPRPLHHIAGQHRFL